MTLFLENNKNLLLKKFTYIYLLKYTLNTPKINDLYIGMTILFRHAPPHKGGGARMGLIFLAPPRPHPALIRTIIVNLVNLKSLIFKVPQGVR